jgi:hypothetical protein
MDFKDIQNATPRDIDLITHVIENYDFGLNINTNNEKEYDLSVKINEHNIFIEKLKELGHS